MEMDSKTPVHQHPNDDPTILGKHWHNDVFLSVEPMGRKDANCRCGDFGRSYGLSGLRKAAQLRNCCAALRKSRYPIRLPFWPGMHFPELGRFEAAKGACWARTNLQSGPT